MTLWITFAMFIALLTIGSLTFFFSPGFRRSLLEGEHPGRARGVRFEAVAAIVIYAGAAFGVVVLADKLRYDPLPTISTHPAESVVRSYYRAVNAGIAGREGSFSLALGAMSEGRRESLARAFALDAGAPGAEVSGADLAALYEGSGHHTIVDVHTESADEKVVYCTVSYRLAESHPVNPLFAEIGRRGERIRVDELPDIDALIARVLAAAERCFEIPRTLPSPDAPTSGQEPASAQQPAAREPMPSAEAIAAWLRGKPLEDLYGHRLLTEMQKAFDLPARSDENSLRTGGLLKDYAAFESRRVRVVRNADGAWKVDHFRPIGSFARPLE